MDTADTQAAAAPPAPTPLATEGTGVLAKLRARKDAGAEMVRFTLPDSGVEVAFPRFRPYAAWSRAQRLADGEPGRVQLYYIVEVCTFDGERLRANDYAELISTPDHIAIAGRVQASGEEAAPADGKAGGK